MLIRAVTNLEVPQYAVQDEVRVDPERTALLVIDMQNDFVRRGGGLLVPDAAATIPAIRRLLDFARASRMRLVYSQDTHRQGDREWEIWPEHCREGSWGWEIVAELAPGIDDTVLRKARYDAFYGTSSTTSCAYGASTRSSSVAPAQTSACTTRPRAPRSAGTPS